MKEKMKENISREQENYKKLNYIAEILTKGGLHLGPFLKWTGEHQKNGPENKKTHDDA